MNEIKLYENKEIRSVWDEEKEEWYFSVVDVVAVLTESKDPQVYWRVLKKRLKDEGNETVTNCNALKMKAADGKMRLTDVADMQGIFRIIQSIPSPKAEPFKLWLAEVGKERIDEIIDPELTIDRALETYLKKGYSREWINQRLQAIQVRKELTDAWDDHGIEKGIEYQKSKIEEIKFFSDKDAQISQKVKILDNSKIQKLQNESVLFDLVAKKLKYKDVNDMISKMQSMDKNEGTSKIMNGIAEVMDDEMKKEENYTQVSATVNMEKINGKWQIKDLNEQIKNIEIIFSNLSQAIIK